MAQRMQTYAEFWPFYISQHSKPVTRWFHFLGTQLGLGVGLSGFWLHTAWTAAAGVVTAYGLAWVSHFFVEKNHPATWKHPIWSLISDFRMIGLIWSGRMEREVERLLKPVTT